MATIGGTPNKKKPKCKYWDKCYRKETAHRKQFLHADEETDDKKAEDTGESKAGDGKACWIQLEGKEVVFTGTPKEASGKQLAATARKYGMVVSSKVTSGTDLVVCGDDPGKKATDAKALGVELMTEEDWDDMLTKAKPLPPKLKKGKTHDLSEDEEEGTSASVVQKKVKGDGKKQVITVGGIKRLVSLTVPGAKAAKGGDGDGPATLGKRAAKEDEDAVAGPSTGKKAKEEETAKPPAKKPKTKRRPKCKYWDKCYRKEDTHLKNFRHPNDDDADDEDDDDEDEDEELPPPRNLLKNGETAEVDAGGKKYRLKRVGDDYSCTCIGWKIQKRSEDMRTCTHLKEYLGLEFEKVRVGAVGPVENKGGEATIFRAIKHKPVSLLLAHKWDESTVDPAGWWLSEKLDGVRAFWDGKAFYSRLGNEFIPPPWFVKNYPTDMHLDGELFGGRGKFQETVAIVKNAGSARWKEIKYYIFDSPNLKEPFEKRIEQITQYFEENDSKTVHVLEHTKCTGTDLLLNELKKVEALGGEGLMIREPKSMYERRRSNTLLKIKTFYDAEAKVIGYDPGKGKNTGAVGALRCLMECGKEFSCGSGLTDAQRRKPPPKGSIITYRFQEYTKSGSPRFPTFVGIRIDVDGPKDAVVKKGPGDEG